MNIRYYYPYRAFGGQNKIVYSTRFVTRRANNIIIARAIILLLPGLHVTNHLTLIYVYDLSQEFGWPDDDHSTHARTPHVFFFIGLLINRQNGSRQSLKAIQYHIIIGTLWRKQAFVQVSCFHDPNYGRRIMIWIIKLQIYGNINSHIFDVSFLLW